MSETLLNEIRARPEARLRERGARFAPGARARARGRPLRVLLELDGDEAARCSSPHRGLDPASRALKKLEEKVSIHVETLLNEIRATRPEAPSAAESGCARRASKDGRAALRVACRAS